MIDEDPSVKMKLPPSTSAAVSFIPDVAPDKFADSLRKNGWTQPPGALPGTWWDGAARHLDWSDAVCVSMQPAPKRGVFTTEFLVTAGSLVAAAVATQPQTFLDFISSLPPEWQSAAKSAMGVAMAVCALWYNKRRTAVKEGS